MTQPDAPMQQATTPQAPQPHPQASPTRRTGRRPRTERLPGVGALALGVALLLVMALVPAPYALRLPGPTFNAIGAVTLSEGAEPTDVITIEGAPSYPPTSGNLSVMTVNIAGSPARMPGWIEAFTAYVTPERDVVPVELYYPKGETAEQRAEENQALMQSSQADAIAAALRHEGYDVPVAYSVMQVTDGGAAAGVLMVGDVLRVVNGTPITTFSDVRAALEGTAGTAVPMTIERDGANLDVVVTPQLGTVDGEERPLLGISAGGSYEFPFDVTIQLGDVGGPSAGLIFALSIIDELTPGDMTGGLHISGTGTISPDGAVGPIGGVRQKLHAAASSGAVAFLVPVDNCGEALDGGVPGDLPVFAVATLDDGLTAVETLAAGGDPSSLPTCQSLAAGQATS